MLMLCKFHTPKNSGLGALVYQDVAGSGLLKTSYAGVQYSFDFSLTQQWHLRPGLNFAYLHRSIDFNRLIWADQISPGGNASSSSETAPFEEVGDIDFAVSILGYNENIWAGATVDHLLRPTQSFYYYDGEEGNMAQVPLKYTVFGGVKFTKHEHLLRPVPTSLHLAFMYRQQENFRQLDLGVYWYRDPLVAGFWYRGIPLYKEVFNRDALTFLLGIKTGSMNIGYSYDFTISRLVTNTGGAHEISLSYTFKLKPIQHKPRMVPCMEF